VLANGSNIPIKDWETAKPETNLHRIYTIASVLEVIRAAWPRCIADKEITTKITYLLNDLIWPSGG
jgi:hypothetical protein